MKEANNIIKSYISDNSTVVLAISGGPDSMVLLNLVLKFKSSKNLNIVCAHVNHKLRKESEEEEKFVKNYCKENGIIFELLTIDEYKTSKFSEADARNRRYKFFNELILKYDAKYLLTAHHGDDLMETILMRITRGSKINGYSGFDVITKFDNYKLVRPLIYETKDSILNYAKENGINYAIDKSNNDDKYTRNRYRKYILPVLKNENENVHRKFLKYSNELKESENFINSLVEEKINGIYIDDIIDLKKLRNEQSYLQKRIVMEILLIIYKDKISLINDKHLNKILKVINDNKKSEIIELPSSFIFEKKNDKIFFYKKVENISYEFILNDKVILPDGKRIEYVDDKSLNNNFYARLSSKEISLPLKIRTIKSGDKMSVKNMNGTKKISDIFTDCKVSRGLRKSWPIVVDSNDNIVWLPGLKKSKFDVEKNKSYDIILKYY